MLTFGFYLTAQGNIGAVFYRHGWDFQDKISDQYGGVVRLNGLFKVCLGFETVGHISDIY